MMSEIISEILYHLRNYLGNYYIWSQKLSRKFYIISEILYHLRSYLGSFISSQKFCIISETILEILNDLRNDLGNFLWSWKFYIILETLLEILNDLGNDFRNYTWSRKLSSRKSLLGFRTHRTLTPLSTLSVNGVKEQKQTYQGTCLWMTSHNC